MQFPSKTPSNSDEIGVSDLIISTYVTNWAFNSGKKGQRRAVPTNILKQIKNENSMLFQLIHLMRKSSTIILSTRSSEHRLLSINRLD